MGVREDQKTASCPRCGRQFQARRARAYHKTEDLSELARVVGEMNARLERGFKRYERDARRAGESRTPSGVPAGLEAIAARVMNTRGRRAQLEAAVRMLCAREGGGFSSGELEAVLAAASWQREDVAAALDGLLREGNLVEPRPDTYRPA